MLHTALSNGWEPIPIQPKPQESCFKSLCLSYCVRTPSGENSKLRFLIWQLTSNCPTIYSSHSKIEVVGTNTIAPFCCDLLLFSFQSFYKHSRTEWWCAVQSSDQTFLSFCYDGDMNTLYLKWYWDGIWSHLRLTNKWVYWYSQVFFVET